MLDLSAIVGRFREALREKGEPREITYSAFDGDDLAEPAYRALVHPPATPAAAKPAAARAPIGPGGATPDSSRRTVTVVGNCQSRGIAASLAAMFPTFNVQCGFSRDIRRGLVNLDEMVANADTLVVQTCMSGPIREAIRRLRASPEVITIPTVYYTGFHPDFVYATSGAAKVDSPLGPNSAIALHCWKSGLEPSDAVALFQGSVYSQLGYFDHAEQAKADFLEQASSLGFDMRDELARWLAAGVPLYCPNHPKLIVLAGLARAAATRLGQSPSLRYPENLIIDSLAGNLVWPVYPEIASALGASGEYVFKPAELGNHYGNSVPIYALSEFVEKSYEAYAKHDPAEVRCTRLDEDPRYALLLAERPRTAASRGKASHPYRGLPDHQFWQKAVADVEPKDLDPVVNARTRIETATRIATAGSCFAQHIARALQQSGFTYYVAEAGETLPAEEARARQYGVFSARYGNVYTATQMLQLFDRANGDFTPVDDVWRRPDGRYVDAFRPQVEPDGFETADEVRAARVEHFAAIREMWKTLDVFVFTLGLTEGWRSKLDGAVYPLAPGVAAGEMDVARYEFHNYTAQETAEAMGRFLARLKAINSRVKVILTVSPVPLAATYEDRHVLVSTAYSKAALRVAAEQLAQGHDWVEYFPSYEIITGAYSRGAYFDKDLRTVTPAGVAHVMSRFLHHHTVAATTERPKSTLSREMSEGQEVICEEELLTGI